MLHDFYTDEDGDIDMFYLDNDYHNGPGCRRCGDFWCHHCDRGILDEVCPNGQQELF